MYRSIESRCSAYLHNIILNIPDTTVEKKKNQKIPLSCKKKKKKTLSCPLTFWPYYW